MASAEYTRLSADRPIPLQDRSLSPTHSAKLGPSRSDRSSLSSDGSDLVYRDNLEDDPFNEKDERFEETPQMEDGEEGYDVQPRRVSEDSASNEADQLTRV